MSLSLRWLLFLTTGLIIFSTGTRLGLAAQPSGERTVSDQDVDRYIASFTARPKLNAEPSVNYRSFVNQVNTPVAWFVGRWLPPGGEGEINVYPSMMSDRGCVVIKTPHSVAYSDAKLDGRVLRMSNPLFTDRSQGYLDYASSGVLIPVIYHERGYLGWGVPDPARKSSRFLTLAFNSIPTDLSKLLSGKTGSAIAAQFQAAGCQNLATVQSEAAAKGVQQTIDNVRMQVQPISTSSFSQTLQLTVENRSNQGFGFMPNRVAVYDQNQRRLPSQFSTLVYGTVIQPGGVLKGIVTVYTKKANSIVLKIPEATPNRRIFTLPIVHTP